MKEIPLALLCRDVRGILDSIRGAGCEAIYRDQSCVGICPSAADFFALQRGEVVPLTVYAVDALGSTDAAYTSTVTFTSTDPLATLPPTYTFAAADQGIHLFLASTAFQTLGFQTVSASDATNGISGSASVTIIDLAVPVPAITTAGLLASVALLAGAGIWLTRGAGA